MENLDEIIESYINQEVAKNSEKFDSGIAFDREMVDAAVRLNLLNCIFQPPPFQADGLYALARTVEKVSSVCGNTRNYFLVSCGMFGKCLERFCSANDYIRAVYDDTKSGKKIGAVAITEPSGGSDLKSFSSSLIKLPSGCTVLRGHKKWITFGAIADFFLVAVWLDGKMELALIPSNSTGVRIESINELVGNHGSGISEITFDDVPVENYQILPRSCEVSDWPAMDWIFSVGRVLAASSGIGISKSAIHMCFTRLKSRSAFRKKLIKYQSWQQELATLYSQLRALECIRDNALSYLQENRYNPLNADCAIAKNLATELVQAASMLNVRAHGADGYVETSKVNRMMREGIEFEFIEGTTLVLNQKIFSQLAGLFLVKGNI